MVNGDITVRNRLERNDAPAQGDSPQRKPESRARGRMCPAMSQQRTDIGNEAAPTEVHSADRVPRLQTGQIGRHGFACIGTADLNTRY